MVAFAESHQLLRNRKKICWIPPGASNEPRLTFTIPSFITILHLHELIKDE